METATTQAGQVHPHIRWMIQRDIPEVLAIEEECFLPYQWVEEDFLAALRRRACIGMVVEDASLGPRYAWWIVGFLLYELHEEHVQLINFAVHPFYRRQGVGAAMVQKIKTKLSAHRRNAIEICVRDSNLAAQLFFRSQGFLAVGVLPEHYEDSGENAYLMQYLHEKD